MSMTCSDCGRPITPWSKTGRCQPCSASALCRSYCGENSPTWKGDKAKPENLTQRGRKVARRLYPIPSGYECEAIGCNSLATDHHHLDGNTDNNERSNIEFLCHPCHMSYEANLRSAAAVG
jgi:hypothetical protein